MEEEEFQQILRRYRSLLPQGVAPRPPLPPASLLNDGQRRPVAEAEEEIAHAHERFILSPSLPPMEEESAPPPGWMSHWSELTQLLDMPGEHLPTVATEVGPLTEDAILPAEPPRLSDEEIRFARELYHREMDLREHYNPNLGLYPGRARPLGS